MGGEMMPHPSGGKNGGNEKKKGGGGKRSRPSFQASFPAPRRAAPSLHGSDLSQPLLGGGKNGSKGSGNGPAKGSGGIVYRSADSTQRTLNELAKRRHERMERRRAAALLAALGFLALVVHFASREPPDPMAGANALRGSEGGDGGNGTAAAGSDINWDMLNENDDELADDAARDFDEEPAIEREIAEDKMPYLGPLRYFEEVRDPPRRTDVPFFFHIPRSGGQTFKDIAGQCLNRVLASEVGIRDGHGQDPTLAVVEIEGNRYVNVDTTSTSGLDRAVELGMASSGMAEMVASSYMKEAGVLFDLQHQGRAFTVIRHPVERAVSMYYYRTRSEKADLDPDLTLESFAQGEGIENNWMTRFLIDRMEGELTKKDLEKAKEVLEKKFLIGLIEDGKETVSRIMKYYGWEYVEDETEQMRQEDCIDMLVRDGTNAGPEEYDLPKKGTQPYALISWQTQFDMKLYEFAKELFEKQTKQWGSRERKKELKRQKKKEKAGK